MSDISNGTAVMHIVQDTLESQLWYFLYFPLILQICGYKDVPASEVAPRMARPNGIVRIQYLYGKY